NRNDQLWVPIAFPAEEASQRGNHFLEVIARLKPGITLKQAQAEMETIAARLAQQYPDYNTRIGAVVVPLHEEVVGDIKPALIFTAFVAIVTGIAFGLAPALQASHLNLNDTLKEGGRDTGGGSKGNRLRSVLVIGEVAVSFVLLIGAGLLINSFFHLRNLEP